MHKDGPFFGRYSTILFSLHYYYYHCACACKQNTLCDAQTIAVHANWKTVLVVPRFEPIRANMLDSIGFVCVKNGYNAFKMHVYSQRISR